MKKKIFGKSYFPTQSDFELNHLDHMEAYRNCENYLQYIENLENQVSRKLDPDELDEAGLLYDEIQNKHIYC
jgi:hypothetical protein